MLDYFELENTCSGIAFGRFGRALIPSSFLRFIIIKLRPPTV